MDETYITSKTLQLPLQTPTLMNASDGSQVPASMKPLALHSVTAAASANGSACIFSLHHFGTTATVSHGETFALITSILSFYNSPSLLSHTVPTFYTDLLSLVCLTENLQILLLLPYFSPSYQLYTSG
ncbi:hypothetical protein AMATHDRAFT_51815 [Amanita thiersii Skay4041]|uniref:Uncharacterized protein n=1 Tax=Amanita thiersii Skay4041 TaxID=703135 RepID=A0A2A9NB95_9AGAR|nr:hypothetical protein AMATHDRAFT_51815 [Amanita thiersii Skay4041]